MTGMDKLDRKCKNQITKDWKVYYPLLGVYKPMKLLKRNGPLLVGLVLDRDHTGTQYIPIFHVHLLLFPFDCLTQSLRFVLCEDDVPGIALRIKTTEHEVSVRGAATHMLELRPELGQKSISLSHLQTRFREYILENRWNRVSEYSVFELVHEILLLFWFGLEDKAKELCAEAETLFKSYPPEHLAQCTRGDL
jgi:hypothetical protein